MLTVDPYSPEALADRPRFHAMMREQSPVSRSADGQYYYVTGYDAVKQVLETPEAFTKEWGSQLAPMERGVALNQDPPQFLDFRRLYNAYMSPAGVRRWTADCARIANEAIDALEPLGSGDLQSLFGKPVPAKVAARALGFPEDQVDRYRAWTDAFLDAMVRDPAAQQAVIAEMYAFFAEQIELKREKLRRAGIARPGPEHVGTVIDDSLTSVLLTSPYQGRTLREDEIQRTLRGFFVGAVDTTGALMLNVLTRLLEVPSRWRQVLAEPTLLGAAIEESLRMEPPALGMFRGTTRDVEIAGEVIPANSRVLFSVLSANRDPRYFPDPDEFRLDRKGQPHIAFGSGVHFCPGAWTARLEARAALEVLVRRLPKLRLTGPLTHFSAANFWIVRTMPAAWD